MCIRDRFGAAWSRVNFEFTATTKSEDINYTTVPDNATLGDTYTIDFIPATGHTQNVDDSEISIDFSSLEAQVSQLMGGSLHKQCQK